MLSRLHMVLAREGTQLAHQRSSAFDQLTAWLIHRMTLSNGSRMNAVRHAVLMPASRTLKAIADPAHRFDHRALAGQLLPQRPDMHIDRSFQCICVFAA